VEQQPLLMIFLISPRGLLHLIYFLLEYPEVGLYQKIFIQVLEIEQYTLLMPPLHSGLEQIELQVMLQDLVQVMG
ncbi:uncharacterized protein METZ01_LOCUS202365, partial [marine metagenome]